MTVNIVYRTSLTPIVATSSSAKGTPLSNAEMDGNLKAISNELEAKADKYAPTFTGTVVLPGTTSIGSVSQDEIGYLDGVTSNVQTQLNAKASSASHALTGTPTAPTATAGTSTTQIATTEFVTNVVTTKSPTANPTFTGVATAPRFTSTIATGTAPFTVSSTTKVTNLNADLLDDLTTAVEPTANTIAARSAAGDLSVRLLKANYTDETSIAGAIAYRVNNSTDNYTRYCNNPSAIRTFLGVPAGSGTSTGTNTGDQTSVSGNAGTVTNGVYTIGNQTIGGIKTFSSSIVGTLSGTATYVSGTQQASVITGVSNPMNLALGNSINNGSFVCKAGGASDGTSNLAGMTFWHDSYAIKMGVRADGVFGIGGWSRAAWSWYSDAAGNMVAAGNMSGYSDPRLKDNVELISDPFSLIENINGVTFNWNNHSKLVQCKWGKRDYGVLSSEVKTVMPEVITQSISDEETGEVYDTVDYTKLVPVLLEAIKQLKREVDILKLK